MGELKKPFISKLKPEPGQVVAFLHHYYDEEGGDDYLIECQNPKDPDSFILRVISDHSGRNKDRPLTIRKGLISEHFILVGYHNDSSIPSSAGRPFNELEREGVEARRVIICGQI